MLGPCPDKKAHPLPENYHKYFLVWEVFYFSFPISSSTIEDPHPINFPSTSLSMYMVWVWLDFFFVFCKITASWHIFTHWESLSIIELKKENAPNFFVLTFPINGWSMSSLSTQFLHHGLNPGRTYLEVWLWHIAKNLPRLIHFKSLPRASSCYEYTHTLFEADLGFLALWIQMSTNGIRVHFIC